MSSFNEIALVKVSHFSRQGKEADKNGVPNAYLQCIAGKIPNKALVIAGTVAVSSGLNIGDSLLVNVTEREPDAQYGRQFQVTSLGKPSMIEIIGLRRELGAPLVFDATAADTTPENVPTPEEVEANK